MIYIHTEEMFNSKVLQCSESQKSAILEAFGRNAETVRQDVENIEKWMAKQPHLPEIPDAKVIESFLIINKFRIEKTKNKLDMYFTVRSIIPEFYDKNPNDSAIQKIMDMGCFMPLPKLTEELLRIVIIKLKDPNADFDVVAYIAHTLNVAEIRLREEYSLGEVQIYDLSGLKINHLTKFTPAIIRKGSFVLEKVFSSRPQGIHFVNGSSFVDSFITLLKTLLNAKLAERVFVHKDMESLYNLVPRNVLPKEYGGEEKSLDELNEEWKTKFLEYDALFQHLRGLKVNEELRQDEHVNDELLELQGNFRQLTVD